MKFNKLILITSAILAFSMFIIKGDAINLSMSSETSTKTFKEKKPDILLVNNDNKIGSYKPKELRTLDVKFIDDTIKEEKQLEKVAADALEKLFKTAKEEESINFLATSGYRSYKTQKETYIKRVIAQGKKKAEEYVAIPGTSEHQTGLAIDVTNEDRWFVESTKEAQWLAENAHRFGFIIRYPKGKETITGKKYEPWHIRYVGKDIAKDIFEKGVTLEEYVENKAI